MKPSALFKLLELGLARDRFGAAFATAMIAVGIGTMTFFLSLGMGLGKWISDDLLPNDLRFLEVVGPRVTVGAPWQAPSLNDRTLERLSNLPEVERAFRKLDVALPAIAHYEGGFFGAPLRAGVEVLAAGIEPALVIGDVRLGDFSDPPVDRPIPALISSRLLDLYNHAFAPARGFPHLSASMLVGFSFPIELGRSFFGRAASGSSASARLQVVGISDKVPLANVYVPLATAQRLNHAVGQGGEALSAVVLQLRRPSDASEVEAKVKRMGLSIDDQGRSWSQKLSAAVAGATWALTGFSLLICALATVSVGQLFVQSARARRRDIGVFRAVGATRADVLVLFLTEAALLGGAGGLGGVAAAVVAGKWIDRLVLSRIGELSFRPQTLFALPGWLLGGAIALSIASAVAGAVFPSRSAAANDPARVL